MSGNNKDVLYVLFKFLDDDIDDSFVTLPCSPDLPYEQGQIHKFNGVESVVLGFGYSEEEAEAHATLYFRRFCRWHQVPQASQQELGLVRHEEEDDDTSDTEERPYHEPQSDDDSSTDFSGAEELVANIGASQQSHEREDENKLKEDEEQVQEGEDQYGSDEGVDEEWVGEDQGDFSNFDNMEYTQTMWD